MLFLFLHPTFIRLDKIFFSPLSLTSLVFLHHVEMKQEKHWTINNYLFITKMNSSGCIRGIYLVWLTLSTGTFLIQL